VRGEIWNWTQSQSPSPEISALQEQVLKSATFQDPMLALKMFSELPNTPAWKKLIPQIAGDLLNGGSALYRFDQLYAAAPDSLQAPLAEAAFTLLRTDNFSDPQSWVGKLKYLPASEATHGAESLGRVWAQQSPADAVTWANSLPQGNVQDATFSAITSGWAGRDPSGAFECVLSMSPGPQRDSATKGLVAAVATQWPADAWNWAMSITDTAQRDSAAASVIGPLAKTDPNAARQWIDSAPLNANERANLRAMLSSSGNSKK